MALEYVGVIAVGVVLFTLGAIVTAASLNMMRKPRERGLLSRLLLGDPLTGLRDLWRRDGLDGFLFGQRRH